MVSEIELAVFKHKWKLNNVPLDIIDVIGTLLSDRDVFWMSWSSKCFVYLRSLVPSNRSWSNRCLCGRQTMYLSPKKGRCCLVCDPKSKIYIPRDFFTRKVMIVRDSL